MKRTTFGILLAAAWAVQAADVTPAERTAGHALDHVIVRFHTGTLARAGMTARALSAADTSRLGLPTGARLAESGFVRWRRERDGDIAATLDAREWLYCQRPATQSVDQLLTALKANPLVDYAEPDHIGTGNLAPSDPSFSAQWHHNNSGSTNAVPPDIRSTNAWVLTTGSTNVVLAMLDSGVSTGATEFAGHLLPGYDFANSDANPSDDHGHGTATAGTAAANANNAAVGAGLDWQCRILPVKVLNSGNWGYYSWWASGISYAIAQGAEVINLSAGGVDADITLSNAVMSAINTGVIFVASAGNDGTSAVVFPGRMLPCITVGATTSNDQRASYSNYGVSLDLCAPGSAILTVSLAGGASTWSGTSFSAPLVSATACLILSVRPGLDQEAVRTLLCASADDQVGNPAEDVAGFDNYYGWGRLNTYAALQLALARFATATNGEPNPAFSWTAPANAGRRHPFRVDAAAYPDGPWTTAAAPASVTYTSGVARWSDAGAATSAGPRLFRLAVPAP